MPKHILIATDGSDLATKAVAYGIELAKAQKTPATVVTVTERWSAFDLALDSGIPNPNPLGQYEAQAAAAAKKILDAAGQVAAAASVACKLVHVPDRHPAEGIIAAAQENGCDLIVMASHGRRGVDRLLLGSRAQEVLAMSTVAVLIVR
jgi:nucleotide-binding universal stress UspA family protein